MGLFDLFQENIGIEEGLEKMKEVEGAVLLDVRSEEEYQEGHLEGALTFRSIGFQRFLLIKVYRSLFIV